MNFKYILFLALFITGCSTAPKKLEVYAVELQWGDERRIERLFLDRLKAQEYADYYKENHIYYVEKVEIEK